MGSALLAQQNFLYALEIERIKALGLEQRLLNRVKELEKKLLNRKAAGPASQPACPSLRRKFLKRIRSSSPKNPALKLHVEALDELLGEVSD